MTSGFATGFVAEAGGNPLALLELPRGLGLHELAGGFGVLGPGPGSLSAAVEESFRRGVQALPAQTRRPLLLAAAEPLGDPVLLWRVAATLGIGADAAPPAAAAGLAEFGVRVRFRHPLARSAVYRSASVQEKRSAHRALAEATDPQRDPDRWAWHRAQATDGPDEDVADELGRSADRAQARGGLAAAAAFLERATMLTPDSSQCAERALAASSAKTRAGAFDAAWDLLLMAEGGPLNDHEQARADLIRAQLAYVTGRGNDAAPLLLKAAQRLEPIDTARSRRNLSRRVGGGVVRRPISSRLWAPGGGPSGADLTKAADSTSVRSSPRRLSAHFTDGYAAALPILRRAVSAARDASAPHDEMHWLVAVAAVFIWDDEGWNLLTTRHMELARAAGALTELPQSLGSRATTLLLAGELDAPEALLHEGQTIRRAIGDSFAADASITLLAFRGDHAQASALIAATTGDVLRRGEGFWLSLASFVEALVNIGMGNHRAALGPAASAEGHPELVLSAWAAVELVEAAACSGAKDTATAALARLTERTSACVPIGRWAWKRGRARC